MELNGTSFLFDLESVGFLQRKMSLVVVFKSDLITSIWGLFVNVLKWVPCCVNIDFK